MNNLGEFLSYYRTNIGKSQREFAKLVGVNPKQLAKAETGETKTPNTILAKLKPYLTREEKEIVKALIAQQAIREFEEANG